MESRTVIFLLAVCVAAAASASVNDDYNDFKHLVKILSKPRMLDRNKYTNEVLREGGMVQGVTWKNCGSSSDPLQIKSLSISPDPMKIPGNITLTVSASTDIDLQSPIQIDLVLKKKILFWIEIPCVDNVGSCTYNDICGQLATIKCPPELTKHGINCRCPFKKGTYTLPSTDITIPNVGLPTWLENGDYQATAKLSSKGQPLGCLFAQLSLAKGGKN